MPLAGLVLNRMRIAAAAPTLSAERAERRRRRAGRGRDARAGRGGAAGARRPGPVAARDRRMRDRFTGAHPDVPIAEVPALPTDVHDLDGLRRIGTALAG